jgi:hypothetical protein
MTNLNTEKRRRDIATFVWAEIRQLKQGYRNALDEIDRLREQHEHDIEVSHNFWRTGKVTEEITKAIEQRTKKAIWEKIQAKALPKLKAITLLDARQAIEEANSE